MINLGSLLQNVAGPLASAGGDAVLGLRQDKLDAIKAQMEEIAQQRQAKNDAIANFLKMREAGKLQLGDPTYAQAMGDVKGAESRAEVPSAIDKAKALAPIDVQKATAVASATAPIQAGRDTQVHAANRAFDIANPDARIDPLSSAGISASVRRAKAIFDATKGTIQTPDQIRMQTVSDLAGPAADVLLKYHGGPGGFQQSAAATASHVPLAGNWLEGKVDPAYQGAMDAARTLATQYLEAMPKSRFQPTSVEEVMKQIAPEAGDSPQKKQQKVARIATLRAAIQRRAQNPQDLSVSLDDAPLPPGVSP